MVALGYILFILSFVGGAYVSVLQVREMNWYWFAPIMAVGAVGIAMVRIAHHKKHKSSDAIALNIQSVYDSLEMIVQNVVALDEKVKSMNPYDVRHEVDRIFVEDLNTFIDARESIGHQYNLQAYADVMSHFAAGERYINRTWSASADGYIDEVVLSVGRARDEFTQAQNRLKSCAQS